MKKHILLIILFFILNCSLSSQTYEIYEEKGKYGVLDLKGEVLFPAKSINIYKCDNSSKHLIIENKNLTYFILNTDSKTLIELNEYHEDLALDNTCMLTKEDKIRFYSKGKTGLMYFPDDIIVKAEYDNIYPFDNFESMCLLENDGKYCIYDFSKKQESVWFEISKNDYGFNFDNNRSYIMEEDVFAAKFTGKWHIGNLKGDFFPIEKLDEKDIDLNEYDYILTKRNGKYGYMNNYGEIIFECKYEDAGWVNDYVAPAKLNGKYGLITVDDEIIIPFIFDKLELNKDFEIEATLNNKTAELDDSGYPNVLSTDMKRNKFGYKNFKGKILIEHKFDYAYEFSGIYALVNMGGIYDIDTEMVTGGKWGYIAPTGDIVIECIYDEADDFSDGIAKVTKDGNTYYIDYYGKCIRDCP